ncbi:hypothetical protein RCL_jg21263.t1 [Rhizophagus clarus]|uniref:Uncharacterized protein n=1 Tax=Rhizophagus clarus TaxID=94130 RepID=A0A8H3LWD5_9GLOM|nr:hypothetical protein RCL_jg21263.t1 [Rhizophagus clarus]
MALKPPTLISDEYKCVSFDASEHFLGDVLLEFPSSSLYRFWNLFLNDKSDGKKSNEVSVKGKKKPEEIVQSKQGNQDESEESLKPPRQVSKNFQNLHFEICDKSIGNDHANEVSKLIHWSTSTCAMLDVNGRFGSVSVLKPWVSAKTKPTAKPTDKLNHKTDGITE